MTITMVRHGMTQGNQEGRYVGATDMPISPEGRRLAEGGRKDHSVKDVLVTPLMRTQQTAAILFPLARQGVVEGLREMNFGAFEGRLWEELSADEAFIQWNLDGGMQPSPGGEGRLGFGERVMQALAQEIEKAHRAGREELTIVAHEGTIMALMSVHALPTQHYAAWWVNNLEGYRVRLQPAGWGSDAKFEAVESITFNA